MARVHTESDIRAVCQQLLEAGGERALTRAAVQEALKERAVERGLEPTAADHAAVSRIIAEEKAELRAARQNAQAAASAGLEEFPLPDGLEPALEQVRHIYRRAMSDEARRSEAGTQIRIRQIEVQAAEEVVALRREIEALERDAEAQAHQLDETELALQSARSSVASISAELTERTQSMEARDRDTRGQLSVAQKATQEAISAAIDAEQRAHGSEIARVQASRDLDLSVERVKRLEVDLADASGRAASIETRAREAEHARDVAHGRLAAMEAECEWLRRRVALIADPRPSGEEDSEAADLDPEESSSARAR